MSAYDPKQTFTPWLLDLGPTRISYRRSSISRCPGHLTEEIRQWLRLDRPVKSTVVAAALLVSSPQVSSLRVRQACFPQILPKQLKLTQFDRSASIFRTRSSSHYADALRRPAGPAQRRLPIN